MFAPWLWWWIGRNVWGHGHLLFWKLNFGHGDGFSGSKCLKLGRHYRTWQRQHGVFTLRVQAGKEGCGFFWSDVENRSDLISCRQSWKISLTHVIFNMVYHDLSWFISWRCLDVSPDLILRHLSILAIFQFESSEQRPLVKPGCSFSGHGQIQHKADALSDLRCRGLMPRPVSGKKAEDIKREANERVHVLCARRGWESDLIFSFVICAEKWITFDRYRYRSYWKRCALNRFIEMRQMRL